MPPVTVCAVTKTRRSSLNHVPSVRMASPSAFCTTSPSARISVIEITLKVNCERVARRTAVVTVKVREPSALGTPMPRASYSDIARCAVIVRCAVRRTSPRINAEVKSTGGNSPLYITTFVTGALRGVCGFTIAVMREVFKFANKCA